MVDMRIIYIVDTKRAFTEKEIILLNHYIYKPWWIIEWLVSVKNNYVDAYDKHKREYIEMAVVIVLSSLTMIFLNILDLLSQRCDNLCNSILDFPNTQTGMLIQFIADIVPSIAFIYVN